MPIAIVSSIIILVERVENMVKAGKVPARHLQMGNRVQTGEMEYPDHAC